MTNIEKFFCKSREKSMCLLSVTLKILFTHFNSQMHTMTFFIELFHRVFSIICFCQTVRVKSCPLIHSLDTPLEKAWNFKFQCKASCMSWSGTLSFNCLME